MQLVLKTLGWLTLLFGLAIAVATPFLDELDVAIYALGALLVAQAAYVIAYSTRVFAPFEPFAETGLIIASTILAAVGSVAFIQQVLFIWSHPEDPEYAPMTGAFLSVVLALVTLREYAKD